MSSDDTRPTVAQHDRINATPPPPPQQQQPRLHRDIQTADRGDACDNKGAAVDKAGVSSGNADVDEFPADAGFSISPVVIGRGSFATVYRGIARRGTGRRGAGDEEVVAIKAVAKERLVGKLRQSLEQEIATLREIQHEHVVRLLEVVETGGRIFLVTEHCDMGDLSSFIRTHNAASSSYKPHGAYRIGLPEPLVLHFLRQLASALECLRQRNLVHRDLKPQNILLCSSPHATTQMEQHQLYAVSLPSGTARFNDHQTINAWPTLKIADFGFARTLLNDDMAATLCGSPLYMAPEVLMYEKYDAKADLWSLGAILFEMATGRPPFQAPNHVALLRTIQKTRELVFPIDEHGKIDVNVSDDLKALITAMLRKNPVERISFEEFFLSPLVRPSLKKISISTTSSVHSTALPRSNTSVALDDDFQLETAMGSLLIGATPITTRRVSVRAETSATFQSPTTPLTAPSSYKENFVPIMRTRSSTDPTHASSVPIYSKSHRTGEKELDDEDDFVMVKKSDVPPATKTKRSSGFGFQIPFFNVDI